MTSRAKLQTVTHIDGELHAEFVTVKGKQIIVILADDAGEQFLTDVEDAVLELTDYQDRGAAGPWDPGAAA